MRTRRHIWVSGKVQGVNFRYRLSEQAKLQSVGGWTRNLADGRVEAVLEGTDTDVDAVVEWCHGGLSSADVTDVEVVRDEEPEGLEEFEILW